MILGKNIVGWKTYDIAGTFPYLIQAEHTLSLLYASCINGNARSLFL
jgi:hypothetical protein